jgi:hypothetical protein
MCALSAQKSKRFNCCTVFIASHTKMSFCYCRCVCVCALGPIKTIKSAALGKRAAKLVAERDGIRLLLDGYWEFVLMRGLLAFYVMPRGAKALLAAIKRTVCHLSVIYS